MQSEVFLDASYAIALSAIALSAPRDALHARAVAHARLLAANRTPIVTTRAVLLEIGNGLANRLRRAAAIQLLSSIETDKLIEIVPLSTDLYDKAFDLYRDRPDKDWGLVDRASFVVMGDRGITEALTADEHFEQAGFRALLRGI